MTPNRFLTAALLGVAAAAWPLWFSVAGERSFQRLSGAPAQAGSYAAGEILVRFKRGADARAAAGVYASLGDRQLHAAGSGGYALVRLESGRGLADALAAYRAMPDVESVQPNYAYRFLAVPNDPHYERLWGLHNTGQAVAGGAPAPQRTPGADMDMQRAWDEITDCRAVIVAVLDSGVNYTHRDLAANLWDGAAAGFPKHGFDFADNDDDPMPDDAFGHGTHVAGTIGAVGNNGVGTTGVCWQARVMAVRIGGRSGPTTAQIIQGMQFAVANGAKVINMSLGGPARDAALEDEIVHARDNGVIVVAAAGNAGSDNDGDLPLYPCSFPQENIICVAALDQAYNRASFSNFGATSVDVGAPGTDIFSTWPGETIIDELRGWTRTGGWAEVLCNFNIGLLPVLANPGTWCASMPGQYSSGANDVAYKSFDLGGVLHARANFFRFLATEPDRDFLGFAKSAAGGDPFADGALLGRVSGTVNTAVEESLDLSGCFTGTCTFGFRLQSNASVNDAGVGIVMFHIDTARPNSNAYQVLHGTSMAAPHAAGAAALVWAYNPAYTYADVVNAIKLGGESVPALAGITSTGRAVNAMTSLRYINPPAGVAAVATAPP